MFSSIADPFPREPSWTSPPQARSGAPSGLPCPNLDYSGLSPLGMGLSPPLDPELWEGRAAAAAVSPEDPVLPSTGLYMDQGLGKGMLNE